MNSDFDKLKNLLLQMTSCAKKIEHDCLEYGKVKAEMQLEIYKLLETYSNQELIEEISLANEKHQTKFFKEK